MRRDPPCGEISDGMEKLFILLEKLYWSGKLYILHFVWREIVVKDLACRVKHDKYHASDQLQNIQHYPLSNYSEIRIYFFVAF